MRMIVIVAALPFLAPTLLAQEFFAGMEAAVGKIEAKDAYAITRQCPCDKGSRAVVLTARETMRENRPATRGRLR